MISNNNNIAFYAILHNGIYVLGRRLSSLKVVKEVSLISQKAKGNACLHLEVIREGINLAFHTWVVVQYIVVKVA